MNGLINAISRRIDAGNAHRDPEAVTYGRLFKITEEAGEVAEAWIGVTGQNPRKGVTHTLDQLESELYDVVITALGAIAHLHGNDDSHDLMAGLHSRVHTVAVRLLSHDVIE